MRFYLLLACRIQNGKSSDYAYSFDEFGRLTQKKNRIDGTQNCYYNENGDKQRLTAARKPEQLLARHFRQEQFLACREKTLPFAREFFDLFAEKRNKLFFARNDVLQHIDRFFSIRKAD